MAAAPRRPASAGRRRGASTASVVAFRALVAFTVILLLSPQAWFPVLGQLRIAFLAAGDRDRRRTCSIASSRRERRAAVQRRDRHRARCWSPGR